jgi:hypothetical protein
VTIDAVFVVCSEMVCGMKGRKNELERVLWKGLKIKQWNRGINR